MQATESQDKLQERYIAIRNVTWVGIIGNVLLSILKLIFGFIGQSQALIADGLHSLSDLISDAVVLVAARYSAEHADDEHPYGHARFETIATVAVGLILLLVAFGMLMDVVQRLYESHNLMQPTVISLITIIVSIVVKEALYQYTIVVAKKTKSSMLQANAWHHRSDAISSVIALIGVAGSMMGFIWLDAVAAIGVSIMIAHIGWSLTRSGALELVDTGLDSEKLQEIKEIITTTDGVVALHELRTRRMGANALMDVHILVNQRISVSEGHHIGEIMRLNLIDKVEEITEVIVHIDPEDDEETSPNQGLPLRNTIVTNLQKAWQPLAITQSIENIALHYISGKVHVDVYLPLSNSQDSKQVKTLPQQLKELASEYAYIHTIKVFYSNE